MFKRFITVILAVVVLSGCASRPPSTSSTEVFDPIQGVNRFVWDVNYEFFDPYIARPVSLAYVDYVPSPLRTGISNFLGNLDEPIYMLSSLLVLEGEQAVTHFNRFFLNTFFGVGGIIDIASAADIGRAPPKDLGDVMGTYGVGHGPFLMYPVYGPSTLRDTAGELVEGLLPMATYMNFWQGFAKWTFQGMEARAALVKQEAMLNNSNDSYLFTRDAYIQNKNFKASLGEADTSIYGDDDLLDDFLDEIDE